MRIDMELDEALREDRERRKPKVTVGAVTEHLDLLIASKRQQIAQQARGIAEDMERVAMDAERGHYIGATPIQHSATYLNTLCGELSAFLEAREALKAVE